MVVTASSYDREFINAFAQSIGSPGSVLARPVVRSRPGPRPPHPAPRTEGQAIGPDPRGLVGPRCLDRRRRGRVAPARAWGRGGGGFIIATADRQSCISGRARLTRDR